MQCSSGSPWSFLVVTEINKCDVTSPVWIFFLLSDIHFDIFVLRDGPPVTVQQILEFVTCPINLCRVLNESNLNGISCAPCEYGVSTYSLLIFRKKFDFASFSV